MSDRKCLLVRVAGRVQGVGFRVWVEQQAVAHGLAGWVRNRHDGTVEALLDGSGDAVDALVALCRRGPSLCQVSDLTVETAEPGPAPEGFSVRPTA